MADRDDISGDRDGGGGPLPTPDGISDCEGLLCPLPVLRARKRLIAMRPGEVLCIRATDAMAAVDLPHFCAQTGHEYLGRRAEGAVMLHFIRAARA
ncbi:sulfurtransferase TusA family protein [Pseudogemmobacter sonorensis]|uniref:sulfurtransferase TusA family protein n=1 Tax=Pseudogemmobacter sonorensis TaxID=2989681 RepID=UPI0036A761E6